MTSPATRLGYAMVNDVQNPSPRNDCTIRDPDIPMYSTTLRVLDNGEHDQDRELLNGRIAAFRERSPSARPRQLLPHTQARQLTLCEGIPEIQPEELDPATLEYCLCNHGAMIVRGLIAPETAAELRELCDRVIDRCATALGTPADDTPRGAYYDPPDILREIMQGAELAYSRGFHNTSGSAMCVEAPVVAEALLRFYTELGLYELLRSYLGEEPCLTAKKWVLRRSVLPVSPAGWHQDGAFMGTDISSVNLWLPLSRCGGDTGAPGLDLIPARLNEIVSAEDAYFGWSVAPDTVDREFAGRAAVAPVFEAGDALFFDHYCLHRTQFREDLHQTRYALETWFFGSQSFPRNQVPLAWGDLAPGSDEAPTA